MRKVRILLFTSVFTLTLAPVFTPTASPALVRENCSCTAPDRSCSVSISCRGGCTQFCGNNDNCYAYCSGAAELFGTEVTYVSQNGNYRELVAELARLSGKDIAFAATTPNEVFNVGFKKATLWDALELLSEHGTVRVAGQDFEKLKRLRRILLYDEKVSYCVTNTRASTVVNELSALTGLPLRITEGSPMATVNVQLPEATLKDIINTVSERAGIKIVGADADGR
jgi:hypothetical protein